MKVEFVTELGTAINRHSMENSSNTPDFILADFLADCLVAFNKCSRAREKWYGKELSIGGSPQPTTYARAEIAGAVARGWCSPKNSGKVMDVDLAEAITDEVVRQLSPIA